MSAATSARTWIITGAVTAITATGALYGAGLKTRQEFKQEKAAVLEASTEEKIEQLEAVKARYVQQKAEMQAKIDRLTAKGNNVPGSTS